MTNNLRRRNDLITFGDSFFDSFFQNSQRPSQFTVDIKEVEDGYRLEADLPGFDKEDIDISYGDNVLTIQALQSSENEEKDDKERYIRRERSKSSYRRQFLVKDIDKDNIKAKFENGVLAIDLPTRTQEDLEAGKIEIE